MNDPSPLTKKVIKDISRKESPKLQSLVFYAIASFKKRIKIEGDICEESRNALLHAIVLEEVFGFSRKESFLLAIRGKESLINEEELHYFLNTRSVRKLRRFCRLSRASYIVINDILSSNNRKKLEELFSHPEKVEDKISYFYKKRVKIVEERAHKIAIKTTISVLVIGILSLFLAEVPIIHATPFILAPVILASLSILAIPHPPEKNRKKLVLETLRTIYKKEEDPSLVVSLQKEKNQNIYRFVAAFYFLLFFIFFSIMFLLAKTTISFVSSVVFATIVAVTAYGFKKSKNSFSSVFVIERKETVLDFITDSLSFPLLKIEKIISSDKKKNLHKKKFALPKKNKNLFDFRLLVKKVKEKKERIYEE
jgi:hypothetical protein